MSSLPRFPALFIAALIASHSAPAASFFWDADGAATTVTGGAGVWDVSSSLWRSGTSSGALSLWPNTLVNTDAAQLAGTAGTLTLNSSSVNLNVNKVTFGVTGYVLAAPVSGTAKLNLAGVAPTMDTGTFNATVSAGVTGTAGLTKIGTGTLTLSGANSYTGTTFVNVGTVAVSNGSSFGATGAGNGTTVAAGAEVDFSSGSSTAEAFTINGAVGDGALRILNSGITLSGAITLGSDAKLTGLTNQMTGTIDLGGSDLIVAKNSGQSESWSATISGTGGLTMAGGGATTTLTLTGANTYTGVTTVNAGILSVGTIGNGGVASGNLGSATSAAENLVLGGGTLRYTGSTASTDRNFTITGGTTGTFQITTAATTLTVTGASAATNGALTKTGAGKLVLAGINLSSGATTISAGTLAVSGSGSVANSSELNVASGAVLDVSASAFTLGATQTLSGAGTVVGGVTVNGTLAPGAGFGTGGILTFNGALTLAAGSTTVIEVSRNGGAVTSARIQASGVVTFGGTLVITDVGGTPLQVGDALQFFSAPSHSGSFASIVAPPGYTFDTSQAANGQIVVLTAPPPVRFTTFSKSAATVSLTWPAIYRGWIAQSSPTLEPNSWADFLGSEDLTSLNIPIAPGLRKVFYRLRIPDTADFTYDPLAKGAGLPLATVWSGTSVGFDFVTTGNVQIAAYYNAARKLVLAARNLDSTQWYFQTTAETYAGWDSHNYIAMTVDPLGYLHVSANLHNASMNYFRSAQPVTDAVQFQTAGFVPQLSTLWNASFEAQSTYPRFFTGPSEEFIFTYRSRTSSTAGSWHLLKYNPASKTYAQVTGANALFTWTGNYSVYPNFTVSDGAVHCLWMWRRTTDAGTNYRLSYVRSTDMVNWTDAFGRAVPLPIGPATSLTTIDDVPQQGGLLNGQPQLSFDRDGVPLVAYHKYDAAGFSQVYVARPVPTSLTWSIVRLTNSTWTWNFSGGGTLPPGGSVSNGFTADDPVDGLATVSVSLSHPDGVADPNTGSYTFDETTLGNVTGTYPNPSSYASANTPTANSGNVDSSVVQNTYVDPGSGAAMGVKRRNSSGPGFANLHYYLRWETLPPDNSDLPKTDGSGNVITPTPSAIELYRTQAEFGNSLMSIGGTFYGRMFKPATASLFGAMTRASDSAATFGASLSSATAGTANFAQWTFNLDTAGDYALGGETYSTSTSDDSFWVQLDNGPLIDWRIAGRWVSQPVTSGSTQGLTRFSLTRGSHTLRLYAQEAGAKLAYLWLNKPSLAKASSLLPSSYSGFTLVADAKAVSGFSLSSPLGSNQVGNIAHYEIPVAQTGNYLLLGRTRAQSGTSDSFFLSVNGGAPQVWTIPISAPNWTWKAFGTTMPLNAGTLALDVSGREGGSELDSFMLMKVP